MPDDPHRSYNEALYESRRRFLAAGGPREQLLRQLYNEYAGMLIRIQQEADDQVITAERAKRLRRHVRQEMRRLQERLVRSLGDGAHRAAQLAADGHQAGLTAASNAAGVGIDFDFEKVPRRALEQMMVRRGLGQSATFKTLIRRNVEEAAPDIDRAITSAVARGVSNQRLTKEIAHELARGNKELQEALGNLGPRGGRTLQAIQEDIEVPEGQLQRAKRLLYDARRIAVSEINTAYTEANRTSMVESPVVDLVRWKTSTRHDGLASSPDICDYFERANLHGFGGGLYHPGTAPANPHPFCMCWCRAVLKDPEDWGSGNREVPEPDEASAAGVKEVLAGAPGGRKLTDAFVDRQAKVANRHLKLAKRHRRSVAAGNTP